MSVRFEKEPNGEYALVVNFDGTIAADPYSGTGLMQAVDVEVPGEVACGYQMTTVSTSGVTLTIPIARSTRYFSTFASPVSGTGLEYSYAMLDDNGHVFQSGASLTATWAYLSSNSTLTGATSFDGIMYFLGYLFKTRGANIDYWTGSTWVNAWKTDLTAGVQHTMFIAPNNALYITNGVSVARILVEVPSSFDPTLSGTYLYTSSVVKLPIGDFALSLASVNSGGAAGFQLLIGGSQNAVYPWNGLTPTVSQQIYVADSYITKMVSVNQNAFIFPGRFEGRGRIYITNGSQADLYFKIPDHVWNVQDPYFAWGDVIFHRNNLLLGFTAFAPGGLGDLPNPSVWALDLKDKKFRSISYIASARGDILPKVLIPVVAPDIASLGAAFSAGFAYYAGTTNNSSQNALNISTTLPGINATGTLVHSDLIPVGTFLQKKTFRQVEFKLRTPLAAGESLTITPVIDGVTGTALAFQPTITTGSLSGVAPVNFQGAQWLKFIVTMVGTSNASGVRFRELRIR